MKNIRIMVDDILNEMRGEVVRVDMDGTRTPVPNRCVMVMELERVDSAIGPKGESMFFNIAQKIQHVFDTALALDKELWRLENTKNTVVVNLPKLGPTPDAELEEANAEILDQMIVDAFANTFKPIEDTMREWRNEANIRPNSEILGEGATAENFSEKKENGQNKGYLVLSEQERKKGFVRPVRNCYRHVGISPTNPLRDLTEKEKVSLREYGYVKYEAFPNPINAIAGRYWTQKQLDGGCQNVTTMATEIAETYARDPNYYGHTFCVSCKDHLPVNEFRWLDGSVVGS